MICLSVGFLDFLGISDWFSRWVNVFARVDILVCELFQAPRQSSRGLSVLEENQAGLPDLGALRRHTVHDLFIRPALGGICHQRQLCGVKDVVNEWRSDALA
jgi:hypothetical protein